MAEPLIRAINLNKQYRVGGSVVRAICEVSIIGSINCPAASSSASRLPGQS
jgi:hypothetical protein